MTLNLSKVAVGCASLEALERRNDGRTTLIGADAVTPIITRYRPTRHEELVGGSLYWIVKHMFVGRQRIVGFEEGRDDGRPHCRILLSATMVPVAARRKRAHQGWRYLTADDAPRDLGGGEADVSGLPARLARELAGLGLI